MEVPSDEVMCKVIAKWKGWESAVIHDVGWGGYLLFYRVAYTHQPSQSCPDPRSNTDAALELLGWVMTAMEKDSRDRMLEMDVEWSLMVYDGDSHPYDTGVSIPISGEPFRTAVCNLAAKVLGVAT